jgi:hypothetical protein
MDMDKCRYCGGEASESLLIASCKKCGARTENYTARGGEYQREQKMAENAWNRGFYWPKDDPKWK